MGLFFILQLSVISVAPVYASQSISLATPKASNKAATDALLEAVRRKETTSDDIIALIDQGANVNAKDDNDDWYYPHLGSRYWPCRRMPCSHR